MVNSISKPESGENAAIEPDAYITFILEHPGMSAWLKNALRETLARDPIAALIDAEILNFVLRRRSEALLTGQRAETKAD